MRNKSLKSDWDPGNLTQYLLLAKIRAPTKICQRYCLQLLRYN